jgi:hypothetical protein
MMEFGLYIIFTSHEIPRDSSFNFFGSLEIILGSGDILNKQEEGFCPWAIHSLL